ncbi:MAG: WD repeat-containing protein [Candidatus Tokpelaia hoelldobleri]|uniref:WD repeat-containing protein n=1 Tax=Candidatus Tokpelaia hoelldobleri TaxID=1902579 RepID=A0A1U9JTG8_9HYPH|nr:MAG: WD repeat-containing protein [Candidatus Tokpelaia hoelldoblerii]
MPTLAPLDLDTHCLLAGFVDDNPFFALADGSIHWSGDGRKAVSAHDGLASAAIALDGYSLVTGGEDGRVCRVDAQGGVEEIAAIGRKWITALACGPQKAIAFASGRTMFAKSGKDLRQFEHQRSVEGVAFAPKGLRIAVARYHGVTLHWPETQSAPAELEWKGAHNAVTFSPDGRYVITAMQENALHGWRLADGQHLRMSGYPAKARSWSWAAKGRWLATSGAAAAIVWPFTGKDGPMGKAPLELGTRADALVTAVSCHPEEDMVAIGFNDGMILFVRFADQKEVLLRRPGKSAVSSLNWDTQGYRLAFGTEGGECGLIDIAA